MRTGIMETGVMETGVMETGVMETGANRLEIIEIQKINLSYKNIF